jgi:hypothetical protein
VAQPVEYTRQYDFEDFQSSNPTTPLPADQVEAEYNAIKLTTDQLRANLALIQRDDGLLANTSVHVDSLDTAVKSLIQSSSWTIRGEWADMTAYAVGDLVVDDGTPYICYVAHTSSGSIDTTKFSALTAPIVVPDDPGDDDKFLRATGGVGQWVTLLAAHITDVVAGLQSVITAANVGAARTALGITATGDAVATAASAAAARTAIGATTIGSTIFTAADEAAVRTALAVPHLGSANTFTADQTIQDADGSSAEGPLLILDRNSVSPEDDDLVGAIELRGRSDLPSTRVMAKILAQVLDVSDTTEDAILAFQTIVAGTLATRAFVGAGMVVGTPTSGDQGAGSLNVETLFLDGTQVQAGGAWTELEEGTISNAAALDIMFTPSEWRAIRVILTDILPVDDNVPLHMRTDSDGGASFDAGASDYQHVLVVTSTTGSVSGAGSATATSVQVGGAQGNQAAEKATSDITLYDPSTAEQKRIYGIGVVPTNGGLINWISIAGSRAAGADVDAVRFFYSTGNIASGRYKVLGLAE